MQPEKNNFDISPKFDNDDAEENEEQMSEVSTRMMAIKYLLDKEWSTALGWALRNGSDDLISKVATKILKHAGAEQISKMQMFDTASDAFLATRELVILYKFYTYKRHLYRGELKEAMVDLHQLVVDNSSPPEFHAVLFSEMITMMKGISQSASHPETMLPDLNKSAVMDLLRSIYDFEQQQKVFKGGDAVRMNLKRSLEKEINELLIILRPMLYDALVTALLTN